MRGGVARAPRRWDAGELPELRSSEPKLTAGGLGARGRLGEAHRGFVARRGGQQSSIDGAWRLGSSELVREGDRVHGRCPEAARRAPWRPTGMGRLRDRRKRRRERRDHASRGVPKVSLSAIRFGAEKAEAELGLYRGGRGGSGAAKFQQKTGSKLIQVRDSRDDSGRKREG